MATSHPNIGRLPVRIGIRLLALSYLDDAEAARARMVSVRDDEALHDFRVALRRLRSCVRAYRPFFDDTVRKRHRYAVRELAKATGAARDLEVQLAWLASAGLPADAAAGARVLEARLLHSRRSTDREALRAAHRFPAMREAIEPAFTRYCATIDRAEPLGALTTAAAAADLAAASLDELEARLDAIGDRVEAAAIHEARIAGKRVRYLLEPFAAGAPGGTALLKRLRRLQDDLGALHDLDVLLALTHEGSGQPHPADTSAALDLAALTAHLEGARRSASAALRETWLRADGASLLARARKFFARLATESEPEPGPDTEIERKYLLRSMPRLPEGARVLRIDQGYVPGERLVERVRRVREGEETRHYRTVKLGRGVRRIEVEEETDPATFNALWRLTRGRRITKRRYVVASDGRTWEIDRFVGRRLVLAEVELPSEDATVRVPAWLEKRIVREVTGEAEYLNVNLAG